MNFKLKQFKKSIEGKKILVMGLGLQGGGLDAVKFFHKLGAKIIITDLKNEEELKESLEQIKDLSVGLVLGQHRKEDFVNADLIIKNPAVPFDNPYIRLASERGIPIYTSIALFLELVPTDKIIGITGTRGKTTTTYLIYNFLKIKRKTYLLGNIPKVDNLMSLFKLKKDDWIVMELSSWQLAGLHRIKKSPRYAVFTSFYEDHLNYYRSMKDYFYDKAAIFLYQTKEDFLIANEKIKPWLEGYKINSKVLFCSAADFPWKLENLKGEHNKENAAAAYTLLHKVLGFKEEEVRDYLQKAKPVRFRQEIVRKVGNVIFINDSTSTTPVATEKAIEAFSDKPIFLILGGNSKNLSFSGLIEKLEKVEKIFLLPGNFTDQILPILKEKYKQKLYREIPFSDLKKLVSEAYKLAKSYSQEVYILFSPAATSFASFKNEFDRAEKFEEAVQSIF